MGAGKREAADERRERLAQVQAEQQRAERRRTFLVVGVVSAVVLALAVPVGIFFFQELSAQNEVRAAAQADIDGVEEIEIASTLHTEEAVEYELLPPVGGDHHPIWQNCGFYDAPVVEEHAVHSLEHGAVWIAYDPALEPAQVERLRELSASNPYLLVSPFEDLASPLTLSAWGVQLEVDSVDDERLEPFLVKYLQGPQTPEPGASCFGGVGA
ncbi:DUF3105 domain-containing protein [Actinotalea sp. Marseille-Q4924]|uniref:DUF3105 domain-containing protein n=1 Tax=Actinotalea sp. Marseille-Q4924 TaxID=2866571 RepID=UPI001CE3D757|nr:DUF3105 domain-containing protein [Actinotalea sp. Marseille-Q4924]